MRLGSIKKVDCFNPQAAIVQASKPQSFSTLQWVNGQTLWIFLHHIAFQWPLLKVEVPTFRNVRDSTFRSGSLTWVVMWIPAFGRSVWMSSEANEKIKLFSRRSCAACHAYLPQRCIGFGSLSVFPRIAVNVEIVEASNSNVLCELEVQRSPTKSMFVRRQITTIWTRPENFWSIEKYRWMIYVSHWLDLGLLLESLQLTSAVTETCYNSSNGLCGHWKWKKRPSIKDDQSSSMQQQLFMHVKQFHKVHNVQTNSSTKPLKVLDTAKLVHAFCRCDHDYSAVFPTTLAHSPFHRFLHFINLLKRIWNAENRFIPSYGNSPMLDLFRSFQFGSSIAKSLQKKSVEKHSSQHWHWSKQDWVSKNWPEYRIDMKTLPNSSKRIQEMSHSSLVTTIEQARTNWTIMQLTNKI